MIAQDGLLCGPRSRTLNNSSPPTPQRKKTLLGVLEGDLPARVSENPR